MKHVFLIFFLKSLISSNYFATQQSKSELFSAFAAQKFGMFRYSCYLCGEILNVRLMSEEKRAKIISMIRDTIREAEPTAHIILYGSRARGDAREDSDWDVLAIVDKPRLSLSDRSRLQYPVWDKGMDMGEEINVFSYTRKQWEQAPPSLFKHNVMSEGIAL